MSIEMCVENQLQRNVSKVIFSVKAHPMLTVFFCRFLCNAEAKISERIIYNTLFFNVPTQFAQKNISLIAVQ